MLLRETGFTFNGQHSRTMGWQYAEKNGHPLTGSVTQNEYSIAGRSESIVFPGETRGALMFAGSLYPLSEPADQTQAQQMLRSLQEWLDVGQQRLIFDYEPNVYYDAALYDGAEWSLANWFGGELAITFRAQPYATAIVGRAAQDLLGKGSSTMTLMVSGAQYTPTLIELAVINGKLTGASLCNGAVALSGLELTSGDKLTIDSSVPASITGPDGPLFASCTSFAPILASPGANTYPITLAGTSSLSVRATVTAHERW